MVRTVESLGERFAEMQSIRKEMEELQRGEQDRLRLVDLWSFQAKEIADAVGTTTGSVGTLIARALLKFADAVGGGAS